MLFIFVVGEGAVRGCNKTSKDRLFVKIVIDKMGIHLNTVNAY